jgi:hypothetical protein
MAEEKLEADRQARPERADLESLPSASDRPPALERREVNSQKETREPTEI